MSQANENQNTAPNVQDKRKPAPGVLPKNAQTWVVIGLTTVIMLMLWVSGPAKGAKSPQRTDAPKTESVAGLSPAEISARLEQQRREQQTPFRTCAGVSTRRGFRPACLSAIGLGRRGSPQGLPQILRHNCQWAFRLWRFRTCLLVLGMGQSLRRNHRLPRSRRNAKRAIRISIRRVARIMSSLKEQFLRPCLSLA